LARRPDGGAARRRGKTTLKPDGDAQQFSLVYNKGHALETANTDNDIDCGQLKKYSTLRDKNTSGSPEKTATKRWEDRAEFHPNKSDFFLTFC